MLNKEMLVALAIMLSGCTYDLSPYTIQPATNIYSNYPDRISGRWAVHVDAGEMARVFNITKFVGLVPSCMKNSYPIDARDSFSTSVKYTLQNIMENIEIVNSPLNRNDLVARDFDGMVRIKVEDLNIDLIEYEFRRFLYISMIANTEITVGISVDSAEGRLMKTAVEGNGEHEPDEKYPCIKLGTTAIGKATEDAMREVLERIVEHLSNSPGLR